MQPIEEFRWRRMPALCLDWDGTIRRSKSGKTFISGPDDIEIIPGAEDRIWKYRERGYLVVGVTNQGGVAHGHKTWQQWENERNATLALFRQDPFHMVKASYCMADGTVEPYNMRSLCRKPDIGMLVFAEHDAFAHGIIIDWDRSLFVGDRPEDEQCAANARIRFMHADAFLQSEHHLGEIS